MIEVLFGLGALGFLFGALIIDLQIWANAMPSINVVPILLMLFLVLMLTILVQQIQEPGAEKFNV